jgi:hypothetical protein
MKMYIPAPCFRLTVRWTMAHVGRYEILRQESGPDDRMTSV